MKRAAATTGESSLELLLDTICNTFGGVLFISMLVVILLNMTSEEVSVTPPEDAAQAELKQLQNQLQNSQAELDRLQQAVEDQRRIIQDVVDPDARDVLQQWQQVQSRQVELLQNRKESLKQISQSQVQTNQIAKQMQAKEQQLAQMQQQLQAVQQELTETIQQRSRTAKMPKLRPTTKQALPFFLRQGRLCAFARRGNGGQLARNPNEVKTRTEPSGRKFAEPVPAAGLPVDPSGGSSTAIERKLSAFDPDQHFLKIFVWPDSFPHFATVKQVMVERKFEYNLVPITNDDKVYLTTTSTQEMVQ